MQVHTTAERTLAACDLTLQNLVVGPPHNARLRQEKVKLAGQASLDWPQDLALLHHMRIDSPMFSVDAQGRVAALRSRQG